MQKLIKAQCFMNEIHEYEMHKRLQYIQEKYKAINVRLCEAELCLIRIYDLTQNKSIMIFKGIFS